MAVGDATPIQQAPALYKASREKGWENAIFFWGVNEAQIEWLVKAAIKDGYAIDFEEDWTREHAEKIRTELLDEVMENGRSPGKEP